MASRQRKKSSEKSRVTRERKKSKRLGYSLTYARQKRERAASAKAVATAKKLKDIIPALKPLASKTRLTAAEKGKITRYANVVRGVPNLKPVSKDYARKHPDIIFAKGIQAVQFNNTSGHAKIIPSGNDTFIESNGRTWIYWRLHGLNRSNVKKKLAGVAEKAFAQEFSPDLLAALAEKAFHSKDFKVLRISLWVHSGRADRTFVDMQQFLAYLAKWYSSNGSGQANSNPDTWINGIAIEVDKLPKKKKAAKKPNKKVAKKNVKSKAHRRR